MPILVAPVGGLKRFHPDGEPAAARAAAEAGTLMAVSTAANTSLEDVRAASPAAAWFQLYVLKNRALTADLVRRAEAAGYEALVVTVDNPGYRSPEREASFALARSEDGLGNFMGRGYADAPTPSTWLESKATDFTWSELRSLRAATSLPIILKGVQTPEDALLAVDTGVSAIAVSNHGGYALPRATATLTLLPGILAAVGDRVEVYVDGGIRTGSDVLKAVAIGARAVLIGRAMVWSLAVGGQHGVARVLQILTNELRTVMAMCGVTDLRNVKRSLIEERREQVHADAMALSQLAELADRGYLTRREFDRLKLRLGLSLEPDVDVRGGRSL